MESHIRSMPPERIADLLASLSEGAVRFDWATPETVVDLLSFVAFRPLVFERLTLAEQQLIYAVVGVAEDHRDLRLEFGDMPPRQLPGGHFLMTGGSLGPVSHEDVLAGVGADRPGLARVRAEEAIEVLTGLAILWPDGKGGYHLHDDAAYQFGVPAAPPELEQGLDEFDFPSLRRVALTLGLDPTGDWMALHTAVRRFLSTPDRVEKVLRSASHDVWHRLMGFAFLGSEVEASDLYGNGDRLQIPVDGSEDPEIDWMVERGLLVPWEAASRMMQMPREVALAIRSAHPWPFSTAPQAVVGVPLDEMLRYGEEGLAEGSRWALTALAGADTRLLAAFAERPPRLRKDGLLMVRERQRLTEAAGGNADLARVWVEAGAVLGLLAAEGDRVGLSDQADVWSAYSTEVRLASLVEAWSRLADAALWWPAPEDPFPGGHAREPRGARVRWALARALRDLPWGTSTGVIGERLVQERAAGMELRSGASWLVAAAQWYQPMVEAETDAVDRVLRALCEAEELGLVFSGAATEAGWALSTHLREGVPDGTPAGSGSLAAVRATLGLVPDGADRKGADAVAMVGPEEARHRKLVEVARRLFEGSWD
ncbi:hypothetical protein GCM10028793_10620 [Nocardiopsis oceani]